MEIIAYCFTTGMSEGEQLKSVIMKIIDEIYKIGLKIVNITCNMGAANRAMWKCLQRKYLQTKDFFFFF